MKERTHKDNGWVSKSEFKKLYQRTEWKEKVKLELARAGNVCEECGEDRHLQVHHPRYEKGRMPWQYDNLRVLCASCHRRADWARKRGETPVHSQPPTANALSKKFFHSLDDDGKILWQGCVLGYAQDGYYLVQLFSWLCGGASNCCLVHFSDMLNGLFYQSAEHMDFSYQYGVAKRLRHDYPACEKD